MSGGSFLTVLWADSRDTGVDFLVCLREVRLDRDSNQYWTSISSVVQRSGEPRVIRPEPTLKPRPEQTRLRRPSQTLRILHKIKLAQRTRVPLHLDRPRAVLSSTSAIGVLCSRSLTTRRMGEDAPKRALRLPNPCGRILSLKDWEMGNPGLACLSDNVSKMERTAVPCSPYCAALFREIGRAICTFRETPV